jgi:flagellar M-ring protein FliF
MTPGRIRRVTAAVVVNDRMAREGTGKLEHTAWKPRSPEEMQRLEQLARAAVGFDSTRGDQVVMENVSFSSNLPEATPPAIERVLDQTNAVLHAQPGLLKTVGFCALCLLLMMTVVKPVSRQMIAALSHVPAAALPDGGPQGGGARTLQQSSAAGFLAHTLTNDSQAVYERISDQIRKEPAQSTRLLETWINAPKEDEE